MIAQPTSPVVVQIDSLAFDPRNARKHGARNITAIKESLQRFGQIKPIVVARGTHHVIAGNGTMQAARDLGWSEITVVYVDGTEAELRALALADNRTAELAEWDFEELASQARELGMDEMLSLGWKDYELEPLMHAEWSPPSVDPNYTPPPRAGVGGDGHDEADEADDGASHGHKHTVHLSDVQYELLCRAEQALSAVRGDGSHLSLARTIETLAKRTLGEE